MTQRSPTKKKILQWFQDNNFFPEEKDNDKFEFLFIVKRGPVKLEVYRPNGKKFIRVGTRIMLPKEKESLYTPEKASEFNLRLTERLPTLNVDVKRLQGSGIAIYEQIFDDGFTYDRLFTTLRNVSLVGINLHHLLFSVVGIGSSPEIPSVDMQSEPSYFV